MQDRIGRRAFLVGAGAVVVLEERDSADAKLPDGFVEIDRRSWGDTQAVFGRLRD